MLRTYSSSCIIKSFSYFHFVCLSVCVRDISKNIERINLMFREGFPSDLERKSFDFDENRPEVTVGGWGWGFKSWPQ